jgi:hypothetical protein
VISSWQIDSEESSNSSSLMPKSTLNPSITSSCPRVYKQYNRRHSWKKE